MLKPLKRSAGNRYLILFPFAGGYSASFRPLSQLIGSDRHVIAIEPPGHGSNRAPLVTSIDELVELYLEALLPILTAADSFVLFGHSMGGMITHRITQRLEKMNLLPEQVIISGITPLYGEREPVADKNDQEFLDYVVSLGGIPEEMLQHQELVELFLPVLRADFKAVETCSPPERTKLKAPLHVLAGRQDPRAYPEAVRAWDEWAEHIEYHDFADGHMFVLSEAKQVAAVIDQVLRERVTK